MSLSTGTTQQPLRSVPGNVFANQQPAAPRTGTLGSGRLVNGKLGQLYLSTIDMQERC